MPESNTAVTQALRVRSVICTSSLISSTVPARGWKSDMRFGVYTGYVAIGNDCLSHSRFIS